MADQISYCLTDTIYALSSGLGKGGVAIIRVSGPAVRLAIATLTGIENPKPRYAYFKAIHRPDGSIIDHALILYFQGPHSFTGEDVVEFQVHGGRSVIQAVMQALGNIPGCRPAERGEYSRRAVINGKMDLTEAEGLLDLINAETEQQRIQALHQMEGSLGQLYEGWRHQLCHHMGYLEAFIDFPEEEIPEDKLNQIDDDIRSLMNAIQSHLNDNRAGEKLREGFQIAILGVPNVGKSSLINALAQKDVAIVSQTAGTTRDVVEAHLDVNGFPVILADTAGLREKAEEIESEGIRRAVQKAEEADLILHVLDGRNINIDAVDKNKELSLGQGSFELPDSFKYKPVLTILNKKDLMSVSPKEKDIICVSAKTQEGISDLWDRIKKILEQDFSSKQNGLITRERYRVALQDCMLSLRQSLSVSELELKAEELRLAARSLGRITGRIDAEDLLDVIFRDFCIGK